MKKKILLLGNHGFVIYNFRKELIKELLSKGFDVYISLPKDEKTEEMISWGCKFIETKVDRRGTNPLTDAKLIIHYVKILKQVKPDVVLTYTIKPNLYGGLACRMLNIPYINNITGLGSGFSKESKVKHILKILYKVSLKKSRCVFFQNTEDRDILVKSNIVKSQHQLIPGSGVNLEEFRFKEMPSENNTVFIFIARIMKHKGIDQYLEAAKLLKQKYNDVTFNIIGFIEESQPHYKTLIKEYEMNGIVNYLGYQSNVKPFIEQAHCLVQASHGGEGLSNVLLEAGATGRALIASNIAGCRETIDEGVNGFIFTPKEFQDLAVQMEKFMLKSLEDKNKMGLKSRKKVEREFDRKIVVERYLNEINKVMGEMSELQKDNKKSRNAI